jgi:hypothetical protein
MSASSVPASGPAMKFASSITLIPASGFGMLLPYAQSRRSFGVMPAKAGIQ